jgi:hypothetical protein
MHPAGWSSDASGRLELRCIRQAGAQVHPAGWSSDASGRLELRCIRQAGAQMHPAGWSSDASGRLELRCIRQAGAQMHLSAQKNAGHNVTGVSVFALNHSKIWQKPLAIASNLICEFPDLSRKPHMRPNPARVGPGSKNLRSLSSPS